MRVFRVALPVADIDGSCAFSERSFHFLDPDGNPLCSVDDTTLFLGRGADRA